MTITIYSTPYCGFCKTLKQYLTDKNVSFQEVDVAADPDKAGYIVKLTGQAGVPVMTVEEAGQEPKFLVGFNPAKVNALLGL